MAHFKRLRIWLEGILFGGCTTCRLLWTRYTCGGGELELRSLSSRVCSLVKRSTWHVEPYLGENYNKKTNNSSTSCLLPSGLQIKFQTYLIYENVWQWEDGINNLLMVLQTIWFAFLFTLLYCLYYLSKYPFFETVKNLEPPLTLTNYNPKWIRFTKWAYYTIPQSWMSLPYTPEKH